MNLNAASFVPPSSSSSSSYQQHVNYVSPVKNQQTSQFSNNHNESMNVSAASWQPKALSKSPQVPRTIADSMNGVNISAASWDPSKISNGPKLKISPKKSIKVSEGDQENEPMVEVTWNGSTFFVPESMANAYESGGDSEFTPVEEEDIGLEWTHASTTLPGPPKRCLQTIGIPEPIRQHFQSLDLESLRQMSPDDERYKEIPPRYHSAYMLDESTVQRGTGGSFGYPSSLYKVVDRNDSQIYCLRRFENVRTSPAINKSVLSKWSEIRHPNIVSLHNISQPQERGAVFFAHAYHPAAQTLRQKFIDQRGGLLSEPLLWRILIQLLSAIRMTHSRGMALRVISPIHVLLTSGTVVRVNCCGVADVVEYESRKLLPELQVEDIVRLGHLMLSLVSRSVVNSKNVDQAMSLLQQHFRPDLYQVISTLLAGKPIAHVCHLISDRIQDELDSSMAATDALHSHLRNEYENGRLLKLTIKLGLINERPEYHRAPQWSETGDRYILKLFRDYIFHQVQSEGAPVLDAGHVITALNKLDGGDTEKLMLSSRDNKDLLVATFADIRR
jgi:PAB-dependent poly(A)-specific ribonuclease subunit 3